ncbi:MAG TPA: biotin--[acetyl-CoA-carboxylase] ligase [Candidatus Methanomethylicus sp.]|nr:biotin--[acetyl-CoA-carboxylase] ligase [Candidatus Methanomethylicus sp.]
MSNRLESLLVKGAAFSGEALARELGISRTAIFKQIQRLRAEGYRIVASSSGYMLVPRFDGLLPLEIQTKLQTERFGREVVTLEQTDSTQNDVRAIAERGAGEGAIVVALEQGVGKGRMGRAWSSPKGGLWFSILMRPSIAIAELHKLSLLFGVAVAKSLKQIRVDARLKWPNDVLVEGKKVCGILLEVSAESDRVNHVIAGIGINANFSSGKLPESLNSHSTTLLDQLGKRIDRAALLADVLLNAERLYFGATKDGFGGVLDQWRSLSCTIGNEVIVSSFGRSVSGLAVGISDDGSLLVKTEGGVEKILAGDVTLAPPKS